MALWVDKYRPADLTKLTYHKSQAEKLTKLVNSGDFPHLLFCGTNGVGKRTRIQCLLKKIYGSGVGKVHVDEHQFQTANGKKLTINVVNSNYHMELTPSDVGIYDRVLVQDVIKEMAQVQQLNRKGQKPYKTIVLMEAENLTKEAQHSLRRTMEKYAATCKIILCCESASRIIEPLRSRCMIFHVAAPNDGEIMASIESICQKEQVDISERFADNLVKKAGGNMRRALCLLESSVAQHGKKLDNETVVEPEWEMYLKETAKIILNKPHQDGILEVRNRFYELLCRCIPAFVIFTNLVDELAPICDPSLFNKIASAAAKYEHTSKLGSKDIYHLEAFVASVMQFIVEHRQQQIK